MLNSPMKPVTPLEVQRRRVKLVWFIGCQALALGVVFALVAVGTTQHFADDSVTLALKILTVVAAAAVAIIPIVFYAMPPTLPRS